MTDCQPRLIAGPPAVLESAFLDEARRERPLPPILVGHRLLRPYLRRLLGRNGGFVGERIHTPEELVWSLHPALRQPPLGPAAHRILVEEAAQAGPLGNPADTGYFSPVSATPGFVDALLRLLAELRRARVAPEALATPLDDVEWQKLDHLSGMYGTFREKSANLTITDDLFFGIDPTRLGSSRLLVHGVWSLDAALRALLDRLMEGGVEVVVFLPSVDDPALKSVVEWIREREGIVEDLTPAQPAAGPAAFLVSAPDSVREVREAARACLRWAGEGISFHDMAVVYTSAEPYRTLIDEVFAEAGIPVYLHDGRPLAQHPPGRRVLALLDLLGPSLNRAAVMGFLAEAALPDGTDERFEPAAWDVLSKRAGIVAGRQEWRQRLARLREEIVERRPDHRDLARIDALAAFIAEFGEALGGFALQATWHDYLGRFRDLLARYVAESDPVAAKLAALADLDPLTGEVPLARFQSAVRSLIGGLDADETLHGGRAESFGREGITALDLFSTRGLRFEAVAILGLAERRFPAAPAQDALLLDRERLALNAAQGWRLPLRALGPSSAPLQFQEATAAAGHRLQLSYPRSETGSARALLPSSFLLRTAEALTGQAVVAAEIDRLPAEVYRRIPASRFGTESLVDALNLDEYDRSLLERDPRLASVLAWPALPMAREARRARWVERTLTRFDGIAIVAPPVDLSPTKLELYARCPHQFFARHVLRAAAEDEPELIDQISNLDRGSLIHGILERFYRDGDRTIERLIAVADEELATFAETGRAGRRLLWEIERQQIVEDLQDWWRQESSEPDGFEPSRFEVRFDEQSFSREISGVTVRFTGTIDRIDTTEDGRFRVVDYKTGKISGKPNDLSGGRALQLPFYREAAADLLGLPVEQGEAVYQSVTRRGGFKRVAVDSGLDRPAFDSLLEEMVSAITSGDFHPAPGEVCRSCDFRIVCDVDIEKIMERKQDDERVQRFKRWGGS